MRLGSRLVQAKQNNWNLIQKLFRNRLGEYLLIFRRNFFNQSLKQLYITENITGFNLDISDETKITELKN